MALIEYFLKHSVHFDVSGEAFLKSVAEMNAEVMSAYVTKIVVGYTDRGIKPELKDILTGPAHDDFTAKLADALVREHNIGVSTIDGDGRIIRCGLCYWHFRPSGWRKGSAKCPKCGARQKVVPYKSSI